MNEFNPRLCAPNPSRQGATKRRPPRVRLQLELLEDRLVPTVFNVNSLADILNPPAGTVTLRSALQQANATPGGNTINLTIPGTYKITRVGTPGETDNAAGEFAIGVTGGNLSIINTSGGGVAVDANRLNRVFDINPGNTDNPATKILVTLQGFTIQNGLAQPGDAAGGSGGGIRDQGNASLTLNTMSLLNNIATADGGGVSMENAPASTPWTLTVNNSLIAGNRAGDAGGGLETDGKGKVFVNAGTQLLNNTCVNQGAAIWLDAVADGVASVTINNPGTGYTSAPTVTFSAPQNAGETTATGTATITGGVVTAVTITNPGSGYTLAPTVTFSAPPAGVTATGTANLTANALNGASLTLTGVLVAGNVALNGPTGAIGNAGNGAVTITESTIENNFSGTTGGGFGDENDLGTLTVSNSYFLNNSALGDGGGIQEGGTTTTITASEFRGNTTNLAGGAIFANGTTLTILNSTFLQNNSGFTGSTPPFVGGGGVEIQTTGTGAAASTITNTTIAYNSALNNAGNNNGGGIDASANFTGTLILLNDTINANYADSGGGIFWAGTAGSTIRVQNTIIAQNQANVAGPDANNAAGTFTDNGGNLIGISGAGSGNTGFTAGTTQTGTVATPLNPGLASPTNNGGPTLGSPTTAGFLDTEALLPGSLAITKGVAAGAPGTDARGYLRPAAGSGNPSVGALEFLTAQERFVAAVYLDELGRPGKTSDLDYWVNILNAHGQNAVVAGIAGSQEGRDHQVKGWYVTYLGRTAVMGEEQYFVNLLLHGQTEEQVLSQLLASGEFYSHAQTLSATGTADQRFIQGLFLLLLNRSADSSDLTFFVSELPMMGRQGVAMQILSGAEYRVDTVMGYYYTLLHRQADQAGLNYFVFGNLDEYNIRLGIESSGEFFANG